MSITMDHKKMTALAKEAKSQVFDLLLRSALRCSTPL